MTTRTRRAVRARLAMVALATVVAAAGCGSAATLPPVAASPSPSPTPTVEASPSGAAVRIDLHDGWQEVQLSPEAIDAQVAMLSTSSPTLAAGLESLKEMGLDKVAFYGLRYDGLTPTGSMIVLTMPISGSVLEAALPTIEGQLKQAGATDVLTRRTTIGGQDVPMLSYTLAVPAGSTTVVTTGRVYLVPADAVVYDATVSCMGSDVPACLSEGDTMIRGMSVGP